METDPIQLKPKLGQRIPKEINRKLKEKIENVKDINTLKEKAAEIIRQPNIPEIETELRRICSEYERDPTVLDSSQAYQNFLQAYQKKHISI